jgi:putative two-component system response regulator
MPQDPSSARRSAGKIVVADDMAPLLETLSETLTGDGYTVFPAADGDAAMALVRSESPDLVLTDINMPSLSGIELCRQLKEDPSTRLIPVMLLTGLDGRTERLAGIDAGADDFLTKPVNTSELRARVRSLMRLKRFTDELDSAESIILSLAMTVEARDTYTGGHCERMAAYAATLGMHLRLSGDEVGALRRGGYLHDIGKVAIPDSVLQKAGPLTADEFEIVKRHTTIGDRLCGNLRLLRMVRPIVRCHHERADGSGYPDGLAGEDIPLLAQIMGVVDVYDALTTNRPYRPAMAAEDACATLEREADRGWRRADLVQEFTALCRSGVLRRPETMAAASVHDVALFE